MPFNNSLTKDFIPTFSVEKGTSLEVKYSFKLVGVVITSDLSWNSHVEYTVTRVTKFCGN